MTLSSNIELQYHSNAPLNGALKYLQNFTKRTDINNGVVKISARSSVKNLKLPVVKRDLGDDYFESENENGSWYEVDFLKNNFYLKSYFIRACPWCYFPSWQILGSNDGIKYDVIDEVSGYTQPASYDNHFECKYPKRRRLFRMITNGKNLNGKSYTFFLRRIEFYGKFVSKIAKQSCGASCNKNNLLIYCFVILL